MIASCPNCDTRFEVPESRLGASGRKVKCGKCGHLWLQRADGSTAPIAATPQPAAAPPPPIDIPEPTAATQPASIIEQTGKRAATEEAASGEAASQPATEAPKPATGPRVVAPPKRRSGKRLVAMLLILVAVLGLAGLGAMALRGGELGKNKLVAGILGAIGLAGEEAESEGLGFENVSTARRSEGTVQMLVVSGEVVNTAAKVRIIPPLRGALLAADNREVQNWTFAAKAEKVEPGQRVKFETTLRAPSMDATDVKVTFATPGS
ncbi:MAG: zinc-ribbon domain-containing protein [Rhodospirillales bacterium]|nr:zinc-ribbon domain-containing protein [Rhodospirillales bacterium]